MASPKIIIRLLINILHVFTGIYLIMTYYKNIDKNNWYVFLIIYCILILMAYNVANNNRLNINNYYFTTTFDIDVYTKWVKYWHALIAILIPLSYYYKNDIKIKYKENQNTIDVLLVGMGVYMSVHHGYKAYEKYLHM